MDDIAVDYTSTGYLDKHLGISNKDFDAMIVKALITRHLAIAFPNTPLHSTVLFRQLRHLDIICGSNDGIYILPYLEQIEKLRILHGSMSEYSLDLDLPLAHTLQWLELHFATPLWMLGRTFGALREFRVLGQPYKPENHSRHEGLQVDLPACTALELWDCSMDYLRFLSCSNVQILHWYQRLYPTIFDLAAFNSLRGFLFNLSCLRNLYIWVAQGLGIDCLVDFVFCGASEHGVWREIRSVKVEVMCYTISEASHLFDQTVGHQRRYEEWWNSFQVTKEIATIVTITASM